MLLGLALVLATAVIIWAQRQPDDHQPYSSFYGTITYNGCSCNLNDYVCIKPEGSTECYDYRIQRCGGNPGYTTIGQNPQTLIQGWYYVSVEVPTGGGCQDPVVLHVWHSGMAAQEVNLEVNQ